MTTVDGFLHSIDELMRSSMAVEIAKALAPDPESEPSAKPPGADSYAAPGLSSQPTALTPAGLRPPIAVLDHVDLETSQSILKNILIVTPPTTSLLTAMNVAFRDAQTPLPGNLATQQGFAKEDAAQLLTTSSPADRLQGKQLSPLQQVIASSQALLADVSNSVRTAAAEPEHPGAAQGQGPVANAEDGLPVRQHDAASKPHDSSVLLQATLANGLLQTERTGIIDSFILNAAMIPGFPFQIQPATAELAAGAKISEEEALTYLANLGADGALVEKLRKTKPPVGKKLLIYLATLLTALQTVTDMVATELAMLAGDEKTLAEQRAGAHSHGSAGGRRRLYME
jgi:hypothetical protein